MILFRLERVLSWIVQSNKGARGAPLSTVAWEKLVEQEFVNFNLVPKLNLFKNGFVLDWIFQITL